MSTTMTGGWACATCGAFVMHGMAHLCGNPAPAPMGQVSPHPYTIGEPIRYKSATPDGIVALSLDVRIGAREMSTWPVGCIRAFFAGLAQMQEAIERARQDALGADVATSRREPPQPTCDVPSAAQSDVPSSDE